METFPKARARADVGHVFALLLAWLAKLPSAKLRTSGWSFLCLLMALVTVFTTATYADVQYVYDENGRLVQVVAPAGASAQYTYDAAGNISSINQVSASTLSIIEFTANAGPIGATVTIYGTGFSATPSSNTVTFNATAATVTSSTTTQLVVSVPAGATTGKIAVSVGGASAISAQDFTVNAGTPVPTIAGFSPTIGTFGTTVTVNGTNFETNLANDRVRFNGTAAATTSAVATQLGSKVPLFATSGRVRVDTPNGTAVSAADFFVPPGTYTAADVGFTGRTTVGTNAAMNTGAAGKIGLMLFDGVKGQKVGVGVSNVVFSPSGSANFYVKKPNGEDLITGVYFGPGGQGASLPALPVTGTYTIMIVPSSTASVSLTVSVSQDITGTIVPGGAPTTVATTFPGQGADVTFAGTQGQRVSLKISGVTITGGNHMMVSILNPDGSNLVVDSWVSGPDFIDVQSLPVSGTYTIRVDPQYAAIATATLTLYDVPPDTTGTIAAGGASVPVATTIPGQSADLTFAGTQGQRISLLITGVTLTGGTTNSAPVSILKPDGTTLASLCCVNSNEFIDAQVLPVTGTYTIRFHPISGSIGSGTFKLYDVPPDTTGTITPGGASATVTTTVPGQNANLSFTGSQGQRISLMISGVSVTGSTPAYFNYVSVLILKPDGTTLASISSINSTGFIDLQTLPVSGTYTVRFDPANWSFGSGTLTLYDVPPDTTGTITPGGASVTVTTTVPGQKADLTFAGTQGQQISLMASGIAMSIYTANVIVFKPDGSTLASTGNTPSFGFIDLTTLPATGTYTIRFDPTLQAIGSGTLTLFNVPPDVPGAITPGGAPVSVNTTVPGQRASLTFAGTQGQRVSLAISGVAMTGANPSYSDYATISILKPDSSTLGSVTASSSAFINTLSLPVTGSYTVRFDPANTTVGSGTLTLYDVPADATGTVTVGGASVILTTTVPGQNAVASFAGTAGQQVTGRITANTIGYLYVYLRRPDNSTLTSSGSSAASFNLQAQTLPTTGTYTILVDPNVAATGSVTVNVTSP